MNECGHGQVRKSAPPRAIPYVEHVRAVRLSSCWPSLAGF